MTRFKNGSQFTQYLSDYGHYIHGVMESKGFHDKQIPVSESIALMHSELSEALEGDRHGNPPSDHIPEFSSLEEEIADLVIRALHFSEMHHLRLGDAIEAKMLYNLGRPHKHGKGY